MSFGVAAGAHSLFLNPRNEPPGENHPLYRRTYTYFPHAIEPFEATKIVVTEGAK